MPRFRTSELREADPDGIYHFVGVMAVSGGRKEGIFIPVTGLEHLVSGWTDRITICLGAGRDLGDLLDYLFERSSGIVTSWLRPEDVQAATVVEAGQKSLAEAVRRDERLSADE